MAANALDDATCKNLEKAGKTDLLKSCKKDISDHVGDLIGSNVKKSLYDACWQVTKGKLKAEGLLTTFTELMEAHNDFHSLIADVLGIVDAETQSNVECELSDASKDRDRFLIFISSLATILSDGLLKERLDAETLEGVGLLPSKTVFQQRYVKTKTRLYYKQQKFNLLREESEGYSKLITELLQESNTAPHHSQALDDIMALIGCFNLDPNRVLDIILESFEVNPERTLYFIPLIKAYMNDKDTVCHMLGFKLQFYQNTADEVTPSSLYHLAAQLIHHGIVDTDMLLPYLIPSDGTMVEQYNQDIVQAKMLAKKINVVSVSEKPKDDKEDGEKLINNASNNQKLGLVEALLRLGCWPAAQFIIDKMPPSYALSHPPIADAMCNLVTYLIDPLYVKHSGLDAAMLARRSLARVSTDVYMIQPQDYVAMKTDVFPMLHYVGPYIYHCTNLVVKLIRMARAFISTVSSTAGDDEESVYDCWLSVLDENILPSLSMHTSNCGLSVEIWSLVKLLPYELRYRLYGQWKNETYHKYPVLVKAHTGVLDRARYIMKRLAKENVKQLGRQIGKLSHSNPGVLFEFVLSQIQKYDNFIGPVMDSLKYLTPMSYDVLAYCIIEALANPEKERMKHDDTNISLWLQSLANFSGALFKKYQIELSGLLQYIVNQLKANKSYDLLILREVVQKMAGIEVSEEITEDQLYAMSGGDLLKQEGGQYYQVRNTKKSSNRLREALLERDLVVPLCLLMATQQNSIIFTPTSHTIDGDNRPVKLVGKLYDQCHDTFVQFTQFLSSQLSFEELERRLPSIDALLTTFHLPAESAFALYRPVINGHIAVKYEELRRLDRMDKRDKDKMAAPGKVQRYIDASDQVLAPLVDLLQPLSAVGIWDELTPQFYLTFWSLNMSDLHTPSTAYDKQVLQMKQQVIAVEENSELNQSKKKKEKERCISLIEKIQDEEKRQSEHVSRVTGRLKHEKDSWFTSQKTNRMTSVTVFIQTCLFPRCCFTAIDAIYSAKFLGLLHSLKTASFSSLICYDRILTDVTWPMSSCTENEAHRYGRFLNAIFDDIMRWHSDKNVFEKECANFPGFRTVFRNALSKDSNNSVADQLDYENFRHLCYKWQYSMTKVFMICMESNEFLQIRNALIVLTKILNHFPKVNKFGQALEKNIDKMCQEHKERLPDLFALATGYLGQMKNRKKQWVTEADFHITKRNVPAAASSGGKTPQPKADSKKDPAAPSSGAPVKISMKDEPKKTSEIKEKPPVESTNGVKAPASSEAKKTSGGKEAEKSGRAEDKSSAPKTERDHLHHKAGDNSGDSKIQRPATSSDERESKRRKVESSTTKTIKPEKPEKPKEPGKVKSDRKREASSKETTPHHEAKKQRTKTDDSSVSSKSNGAAIDAVASSQSRSKSLERPSRDIDDASPRYSAKIRSKDSLDVVSRKSDHDRSAEKHSSRKSKRL